MLAEKGKSSWKVWRCFHLRARAAGVRL